jgi:GntR family transcriptional regulator, histidine utilization repressor
MPGYRHLKEDVLHRIHTGEWPPGGLIPSEADLAEEYGVSRGTANRAIRELAETGLVERRRRAGTRVTTRSSRAAMVFIPIVRAEIERAGRRYGYVLVAREMVAADQRQLGRLDLPLGAPILRLRSLHTADGEPHQLEDRWINLEAAPGARTMDFSLLSPNEWIVREVPYSRSEHIFRADTPTEDERESLRLREDEPVFVIERRTWLGPQPVSWVRLAHPGGRYRMVSRDDA